MSTKQARIRHKEYGTEYRIIRTVGVVNPNGTTDLYWVMRGDTGGLVDRGLTRLSVDSWATGDWEVCE